MSKLYNNQDFISTNLSSFFSNPSFNLSKPHLKILPFIISSIVSSESVVTSDISKSFNSSIFSSNDSSNQKRIWRFLNNPHFDIYSFYSSFIKHVLSNMKGIKHKKFTVVLDHMFTKNKYVQLVFTLKIGKQSIPIWFKCDKTKEFYSNDEDYFKSNKHLFNEDFIINAIKDVISLFDNFPSIKITFLADRWFCNTKVLDFIDKQGHYFCFRTKVNSNTKIYIFDEKENHFVYKRFSHLKVLKNKSLYYENILVGSDSFKCNLSISRSSISTDDDYCFILSNIDPKKAIREYSHRFGAIECLFKSQKTNGFNLERTYTRNIRAYETLYGLVCIASVWITIIGIDYSKNYSKVKHKLNIKFTKSSNSRIRIMSLFNLGLTVFNKLYNSCINLPIKCNFQLYF